MQSAVVFKGFRDGLQLVVDDKAEFALVVAHLREKLETAANFFTVGTPIRISDRRTFSDDERQSLVSILEDYGLRWEALPTEAPAHPEAVLPEVCEAEDYHTPALVVPRTLRGGQKTVSSGSVVVLGDINPGAEVIAGGNIIVMGTCRGLAHAGASGDETATVTARKLMASQLRIAGIIARAPDKPDKPACAETARIYEGTVVIEPAIR